MADQHDEVLTIHAMDGQYLIESDSHRDNLWPATVDGLTTGEANWVAVLTGANYGLVVVRITLLEISPAQVASPWDMVVERDLSVAGAGITVRSLYSNEGLAHIHADPGLYRMRIHVKGRSEGHQRSDPTRQVEFYYVQFWSAALSAAPAMLIGPDDFAAHYV
jgi:hypothetical protein